MPPRYSKLATGIFGGRLLGGITLFVLNKAPFIQPSVNFYRYRVVGCVVWCGAIAPGIASTPSSLQNTTLTTPKPSRPTPSHLVSPYQHWYQRPVCGRGGGLVPLEHHVHLPR